MSNQPALWTLGIYCLVPSIQSMYTYVDTLYVTGLEHVSAFRPSTGVVHAPLTYLLFSRRWSMFTYGRIFYIFICVCVCVFVCLLARALEWSIWIWEWLWIRNIEFTINRENWIVQCSRIILIMKWMRSGRPDVKPKCTYIIFLQKACEEQGHCKVI
jgi:hypothetical protein